jgi:phage terminase Nu1 subunit (DNA packaging protein)
MTKQKNVEKIDAKSLAKLLGIHIRTIHRLRAKGAFTVDDEGLYDRDECIKIWEESRGAGGKNASLLEVELRLKTAQAIKIELENAERQGDLITIDAVSERLERVIGAIRSKVLNFPRKLAPHVVGLNNIKEVEALASRYCEEMLVELAHIRPDREEKGGKKSRQGAKKKSSGISTTPETDGERVGGQISETES